MANFGQLSTVKVVSRRISEGRGASEGAVARLLRGLLAKGAVQPSLVAESGPTAPNLFDEAAIYRAAILVWLNRLGLSDETLVAIAPCLNNMDGFQDDSLGPKNNGKQPDRMWMALREADEGTPHYCHVFLLPEFFSDKGNVLGATFSDRVSINPHDFAIAITVPLAGLVASPHDGE